MKINDPSVKQRIKGIYEGKEYYSNSNKIEGLDEPFRGRYVDKFEFNFVIESRKDWEKLSEVLNSISYCFKK